MENKKEAPKPDERIFLEGSHSRWQEFTFLLKVFKEFIRGFRKFHFLGPCATVFGSARFKEDHKYYKMAMEVGGSLAKLGFAVMTGGGPGIMEAANRGAKEAGGRSVACNIVLPKEQYPNKYLDKWMEFDFFFVRKVLLSKYSYAFVVMPGGYGTLDEFFEALTLVQTKKMRSFPVVILGTEFHKELMEHLQLMEKSGTISGEDLQLFLFTDSIPDAMTFIEEKAIQGFHLRKNAPPRPLKVLGEKE